jgi:hypothetical protein
MFRNCQRRRSFVWFPVGDVCPVGQWRLRRIRHTWTNKKVRANRIGRAVVGTSLGEGSPKILDNRFRDP